MSDGAAAVDTPDFAIRKKKVSDPDTINFLFNINRHIVIQVPVKDNSQSSWLQCSRYPLIHCTIYKSFMWSTCVMVHCRFSGSELSQSK